MADRRRLILALCFTTCSIIAVLPATASETVDYSYDARGRLIQVNRSGTVNNGLVACYTYDSADNRTNVTVANPSCTPPPPSFAINDVSVTEGGNLVLTVTKSGSASTSFSVNYATANGTAAAGPDYTAASGTLTFLAAETTKTITVATTNDTILEGAETVLVNLSGATGGATISDSQGIGTINDDEIETPPSFAINDATAVEGSAMVFTVTKTGTTISSFSVNYATFTGTALGTDFTAKSGTLTFAPGETTKTVSVSTVPDILIETTEYFTLRLSGATGGATISDSSGLATLIDDGNGEPCPTCLVGE